MNDVPHRPEDDSDIAGLVAIRSAPTDGHVPNATTNGARVGGGR